MLARDPPDLEVYVLWGLEVDLDGVNVQPDAESADLDAFEVLDTAMLDHAGNAGLVVDVARAVELYGEAAVGIQEEELDRIWEEARGRPYQGRR